MPPWQGLLVLVCTANPPGSTLFLVWQQSRQDEAPYGDFNLGRERAAIFHCARGKRFPVEGELLAHQVASENYCVRKPNSVTGTAAPWLPLQAPIVPAMPNAGSEKV